MERKLSERDVGKLEPSYTKETRRQERWRDLPVTLRPIRLIQLILDVMLFSLTIHLWTRSNNPMGTVYSVILLMLFTSFAVLMSVDAVGQIGGCLTPDLPIFLIDFLGLVLFTSAAQVVYFLVYKQNNSTLVLILLCLVAALLFLLDATIMIMFWRFTYVKKGRCLACLSGKSLTTLDHRPTHDEPNEPPQSTFYKSNPVTRDVSTSVSRHSGTSSFYSGLFSARSNNRIGVEYRREYVDAQTDPYSETSMRLQVETQTQKVESTKLVDHETLATTAIEEKQIQTLSECPICSAAMDQSPEGICPSFLALFQSFGMFSCERDQQLKPAKALTLVDRGTLPDSNSSFEMRTESTIVVTKKQPRVYETRPCPTHGAGLLARKAGLPNPVTRVSLPYCIRKNKKTQTPTSKPLITTDEYQNTEIDEKKSESAALAASSKKGEVQEDSTFVKNSTSDEGLVRQENSRTGSISSARNLSTERSSVLRKIKNTVRESKERSLSPLAQGVFIMQRSSDDLSIPMRANDGPASTLDSERVSLTKKKSSTVSSSLEKTPKMLTNFTDDGLQACRMHAKRFHIIHDKNRACGFSREKSTSQENLFEKIAKIESIKSTGTSPISLSEPPLQKTPFNNNPPETSRRSTEFRELTMPSIICQCPQYYYKDVFGRYICGQCSHKHLIKIPQRWPIKPPVGDIRCCSCSQAIINQMAKTEQGSCRAGCKCRYAAKQ